jgi:lipopolysaccharide biosynthesis glycosyltransferase
VAVSQTANFIGLLFRFLFQHVLTLFWFWPRVVLLQLFPALSKVVFLDDDVVVQRDLGPLFDEDMHGKVNGAVETCRGEDPLVMSKTFRNYFNFSHPLIANAFNKDQCAWAYGMNIFDLDEWRKTEITKVYHRWQKLV